MKELKCSPYENYIVVSEEIFSELLDFSGFSIAPLDYYKNKIIDGEEYIMVGSIENTIIPAINDRKEVKEIIAVYIKSTK